ncbi:MAG: hypothetical protein AAF721_03350 [Myxococcota bacterium]
MPPAAPDPSLVTKKLKPVFMLPVDGSPVSGMSVVDVDAIASVVVGATDVEPESAPPIVLAAVVAVVATPELPADVEPESAPVTSAAGVSPESSPQPTEQQRPTQHRTFAILSIMFTPRIERRRKNALDPSPSVHRECTHS